MESIDKQDYERYHSSRRSDVSETVSRQTRKPVRNETFERFGSQSENCVRSLASENSSKNGKKKESSTSRSSSIENDFSWLKVTEKNIQESHVEESKLIESNEKYTHSLKIQRLYYYDESSKDAMVTEKGSRNSDAQIPQDSDSDSDYDLLGEEMALERIEFHIDAWEDAMMSENWDLAVENAAVLSECIRNPVPELKAAIQTTPAIFELTSGNPNRAIDILSDVENAKMLPLPTWVWTVALTVVGDFDNAKKWCGRLIKLRRTEQMDLQTAYCLMTEILLRNGKKAEAMFYQKKFEAESINSKENRWMQIALQLPIVRTDDTQPENSLASKPANSLPIDNIFGNKEEKVDTQNHSESSAKARILTLEGQIHILSRENEEMKAQLRLLKQKPKREEGVLLLEKYAISLMPYNSLRTLEHKYRMGSMLRYVEEAFNGKPDTIFRLDSRFLSLLAENITAVSFQDDKRLRLLELAIQYSEHPDSLALVEAIENSRGVTGNISLDINQPVSPNTSPGYNALHLAVKLENEPLVELLLKCQGILVDYRTTVPNYVQGQVYENQTALQIACSCNRGSTVVQMLFEAGANPKFEVDAHHPINLAITRNLNVTLENMSILETLLRFKVDGMSVVRWWWYATIHDPSTTPRARELRKEFAKMAPT
ncbi:hypothetical protein TWF694_004737 [Orbilia ellipsospora]|uniref:Ankyrin repeat protein n=1 Tax=Orbilia ellipsospora TaxID=2528407 RepID=A0AAV9WW65_9PEZI